MRKWWQLWRKRGRSFASCHPYCGRFEVHIRVLLNCRRVFCSVIPCRPAASYRRLAGSWCIHFQGRAGPGGVMTVVKRFAGKWTRLYAVNLLGDDWQNWDAAIWRIRDFNWNQFQLVLACLLSTTQGRSAANAVLLMCNVVLGLNFLANERRQMTEEVAGYLQKFEHIKLDRYNFNIFYRRHIRKCWLWTILCRQFKVMVMFYT
jgi:hypothetical protein